MPPVRAEAGDLAVFRGPDHYTVADEVATPPQALIHPDQTCTAIDGGELHWQSGSGVRTWGNVDGPVTEQHTVLLTGSYLARGEVSQRLLAALPPLVVVPRDEVDQTLVGLLIAEVQQQRPGQEAVLDRLLDVVLVASLRAWFSRSGARTPGWYAAQSDQAHRAGAAADAAPSGAAVDPDRAGPGGGSCPGPGLARRFTQLVGEPPITFLTGWRLALAADLLTETDSTLEQIARQVGYGDAFALSTAFRRERGMSPGSTGRRRGRHRPPQGPTPAEPAISDRTATGARTRRRGSRRPRGPFGGSAGVPAGPADSAWPRRSRATGRSR